MKYFQIQNMPRKLSDDYAFINKMPASVTEIRYDIASGEPAIALWPAGLKIETERGDKLSSVIPNTCNLLIANEDIAKIFKEINSAIECIPLNLYNSKKQPVGVNYYITNPIGTYDCLDMKASRVLYSKDGLRVLDVGTFLFNTKGLALSKDKLAGVPAVFRMQYSPSRIIVNEEALAKINEAAGTQVEAIEFTEIV